MSVATPSTLSQWAEHHLAALVRATNESSFNAAYDATFTTQPMITVNGQHLSSDAYKKKMWNEKGIETGAQVTFAGAVEVPDNTGSDSGNVGLFMQATIDEPFQILGIPQSSTVTASYNMTVIQEPPLMREPGSFDGCRVSVLSEVSRDKRNSDINPGGPIRRSA